MSNATFTHTVTNPPDVVHFQSELLTWVTMIRWGRVHFKWTSYKHRPSQCSVNQWDGSEDSRDHVIQKSSLWRESRRMCECMYLAISGSQCSRHVGKIISPHRNGKIMSRIFFGLWISKLGACQSERRAGIKGCSVCKFVEIEHLHVSEAESMVTHYSIRI